ncbi:MAG: (d)CMP kinase [Acidimicrobiia bacterium]
MSDIGIEELPNDRIIAIDGTSGSGKSTITRALATKLGLHYLETGSLYRAVTLICLENNVDVNDEQAVLEVAEEMHFRFDGDSHLDSRNISEDIRSHDVAINVSLVSVHAKVRAKITQLIRHWIVQHGGGVIEGRDITTVVAPKAKLRIYIDAPEEIRAQRRHSDANDNATSRTKDQIQEVLSMRDKIDSGRKASPLTKAKDVPLIDTSKYSVDEITTSLSNSFLTGEKVSL